VSKITKKGPKTPEWFQYFVDNQFNPLVEMVKQDHELLMNHHKILTEHQKLLMVQQELLTKIIKLNNLKTE